MTVFDVTTVACFFLIVFGYFRFAQGNQKALLHLILVGVVLAVANQVGNANMPLLAALMIVVGMIYAYLVLRSRAA